MDGTVMLVAVLLAAIGGLGIWFRAQDARKPVGDGPGRSLEESLAAVPSDARLPPHIRGANALMRAQDIEIEYEDADGEITRRVVTFLQFGAGYAEPSFLAWCHLRRDERRFRFDRIRAVIDDDGVVHEPKEFFRELGLADFARTHWREDLFDARPKRRRGKAPPKDAG